MRISLQALQPLGRALMLPIAVLPIAGLLLRLGQPDLLDIAFMAAAGGAVFDNLGLLFAVGIGAGIARDGNGAAGLAGAVCFLVVARGAATLLPAPEGMSEGLADRMAGLAIDAYRNQSIAKLSVPIGIISGVVAGSAYNRWAAIKLPEYLSFFGGRRFVPIVAGVAGLVLAGIIGSSYPIIVSGMDAASETIIRSGEVGLFLYGLLNRLLVVTGMHHILNNVAWFIIGDFHGSTGDLKRFFAGDPGAGGFMSGFFPVMMFGLPAACLAMYRAALPERRKAVGGMLLSMALTAFLTGVTEPIEFTFMFLAPILYALHTLLTGVAMVAMDLLGVKLGFTFSAGFLDYALNFSKATRPLLLVPVGLAYFAIYYCVFRWAISYFDIQTPGREQIMASKSDAAPADRGYAFVEALGGQDNLIAVDACTTRLRLAVHDQSRVSEAALRSLGAKGFVRPGANALQVVLGPIADLVATEMRGATSMKVSDQAMSVRPISDESTDVDAELWFAAIGGRANLKDVSANPSRLILRLADPALLDEVRLQKLGMRASVRLGDDKVHMLVDDAGSIRRAFAWDTI